MNNIDSFFRYDLVDVTKTCLEVIAYQTYENLMKGYNDRDYIKAR